MFLYAARPNPVFPEYFFFNEALLPFVVNFLWCSPSDFTDLTDEEINIKGLLPNLLKHNCFEEEPLC